MSSFTSAPSQAQPDETQQDRSLQEVAAQMQSSQEQYSQQGSAVAQPSSVQCLTEQLSSDQASLSGLSPLTSERQLPAKISIPDIRGEMVYLRPATLADLDRLDELEAFHDASKITGKDHDSERAIVHAWVRRSVAWMQGVAPSRSSVGDPESRRTIAWAVEKTFDQADMQSGQQTQSGQSLPSDQVSVSDPSTQSNPPVQSNPAVWSNPAVQSNQITQSHHASDSLQSAQSSQAEHLSQQTGQSRSVIGMVFLIDVDGWARSARIQVLLGKQYRGRGYSRDAMPRVMTYGFAPAPVGLNLHRIWVAVPEKNTRAFSVYQSLGFVLCGTSRDALWDVENQKYQDIHALDTLVDEYDPIRSLDAFGMHLIEDNPGVTEALANHEHSIALHQHDVRENAVSSMQNSSLQHQNRTSLLGVDEVHPGDSLSSLVASVDSQDKSTTNNQSSVTQSSTTQSVLPDEYLMQTVQTLANAQEESGLGVTRAGSRVNEHADTRGVVRGVVRGDAHSDVHATDFHNSDMRSDGIRNGETNAELPVFDHAVLQSDASRSDSVHAEDLEEVSHDDHANNAFTWPFSALSRKKSKGAWWRNLGQSHDDAKEE